MATVGHLVDQGVRAYIEGRLEDARRLLDEALLKDPANARARSYMILLHGGAPSSAGPRASPVSPSSPVSPPSPVSAPSAEGAAVPLDDELSFQLDEGGPADAGPGEDYAPSPWDDGPASSATIVLTPEGGISLAAVAEKSDLRSLVPESSARRPPVPAPVPAAATRDIDVWMAAAKDLLALDDFSGSLEMIEKILRIDPEHREARAYLQQNEAALVDMYESKLGPLGRVPRLAIKPEEVMWLNLDHRAGFLLSQIDGTVDFESLFALSGLPRLDTARILATLLTDGVIGA